MTDSQAQDRVALVCCGSCQAPVVKGSGNCRSCGGLITGKEYPYVSRTRPRPELAPLFKWWLALSGLIWVFSGFSLGTTTSLLLTGVALVYLVRILRTYYAD